MESEIEVKIIKLLMELDDKCLELNKNMVLCHNDPYDLNVMAINGEYRFFSISSNSWDLVDHSN